MALGIVNVGQPKTDENAYLKTDQVGVPSGLATLGADGKLTKSQRPESDGYTKQQTDDLVAQEIEKHNADATAHGDIRASVSSVEAAVKALDLKYGTNVTKNPFSISFESLNGVTVTGVWNKAQARIEF